MFQRILSRQNRALLRELVVTDFKLRYQGSVLGYLWTLLKPLGIFTILYIVFVKFLKFGAGIEHFPVYLLLGIVLWGFFSESTSNGMQAIVSRGDLLRKIKFPRYIVVVSGTVSALVNLCFNLVIVFLFMIINGVEITWAVLWFPLILAELFIFSLAIAFFLAAAYVKYRDLGHIWEIILQGAFYATPILYPLSLIPADAAKLLLLNPVAQIIQASRASLINSTDTITVNNFLTPPLKYVPFLIVGVSIILASVYFRRSSKYFAENI
jgi:ABC-2 type transport system permease protein